MRRPNQLRIAALLSVGVSLIFALLITFIVFFLLGREGRLGFASFNARGLLEGLTFVISYSFALLYSRNALHLPSPLLLSFGLIAPPSAARAAAEVPVVDAAASLHTLMDNRIVIVEEKGVPIGITGVRRERISSWDELAKVDAAVAVTELRSLLAREPLVVVMRDNAAIGIITQEMYLAGLWGSI